MQKCRLPSFFWTNTTALHHTLWLGWILPESYISNRCMQTSSTTGRGIHLNQSLNGASLVTLSHVQSNGYNWACRILKKKCHVTWWGGNKLNLPAPVAKILGCSSLTSKTAFPASVPWSSSVSGCLTLHPTHLSCQGTFVPQAPNLQLPLLPLGSSSSWSEDKP